MTDVIFNYLNRLRASIVFFVLLVAFNIFDIYDDLLDGSSITHIIEETIMILIFISIIGVLVKKLVDSSNKLHQLKKELVNIKQLHAQQTHEMQEARKSYSDIIAQQFQDWQLTRSESEVGFLLLKGLSLKEIASVRDTKEKSARQQASNIYAKAGLTGRHEFAGWFFEDR
ncbi:MAG: LuxR family transcriptional regulator [Gammaproteobacteria bacterium]|nr:LuxR family transcriptional regulator [Gammaproteobacteria bacterium]